MFEMSKFNQDINSWQVNPKFYIESMFYGSKMNKLPSWYKNE